MYEHSDTLSKLSQKSSLNEKLIIIHNNLQNKYSFIVRIAIAIYEPQTKVLKTYIHSSGDDNPLSHYQTQLANAASLEHMLKKKSPRVINDLDSFLKDKNEHSKKLKEHAYEASYTMPMYSEDIFIGFIFFNSDKKNVFTENILSHIDIYAHMISFMISNEINIVHMLTAAVKTTGNITHEKDPETGAHLERMSRYSRIIAAGLAEKYNLDDSYIEHIFLFAPLHDIGKISIPDRILMKPGPLNTKEREIMEEHPEKGKSIINDMLENFGLLNFKSVEVMKNIAEFHHEAMDGSGYPNGTKGEAIPLEARIISVADIFDALTSKRYYKDAWSNQEAINELDKLSGKILDKDCVTALIENMDQIEAVQKQFKDNEINPFD